MVAKKSTLKSKAKKTAAKKTAPKKAAAKKTAPKKKAVAKKTAPRKKAIGFDPHPDDVTSIETAFEEISDSFESMSDGIGSFIYDGEKKNATALRASLQEIIVKCRDFRALILSAKENMTPIYKDS